MKSLRNAITILLLAISPMVFQSCGGSSSSEAKTEQASKDGPEYTSDYICPMHCEGSGSTEPGKCPTCGMTYQKNDGHTH